MLVIAGAAILPSLFRENVTPEGTDGRYKDFSIRASESAIVWPWEYQTVYENIGMSKLTVLSIMEKAVRYQKHGLARVLATTLWLDMMKSIMEKYSAEFEAYALKDIAQSQFIAVKMEDSYYVFQNDEYAPPNTLGELMDAVNLSEVVELQRFSEGDNTPDSKRFALSSDDYVWEVLSECRNAPFVEDQTWTAGDRSYLSFTITSEALGVYKVALYVTEDGYLWTNAFNYQYLFNIGEDAASKIIKYAKENSTEAEYEPYQNTIVGKITEITDEYILLDDSILCANPDDGITYKILLNDLRISRYAESGAIRVGENVQITYEGEIDESNTIDSAISASDVVISGGDVLIPE